MRPRGAGQSGRIRNSSTTTSCLKAATLRPGNSLNFSVPRCALRSNRFANQAETDGRLGARVCRARRSFHPLSDHFRIWRHAMEPIGNPEGIDKDRRRLLGTSTKGVAVTIAANLLPQQLAAAPAGDVVFETLTVHKEGAVLFADIAAPPMNLLGPALVRDLVFLIQQAEADNAIKLLVFRSADPDYFISHVDVTKITEYQEQAAKLVREPSIAL